MANQITVTTTQVKSKAEELTNANNRLKQDISQLTDQESALNAMWEGEANDAFHEAFTKDIEQMNNFYSEIINYVQKLQEIVNTYDKAEQVNVDIARSRNY